MEQSFWLIDPTAKFFQIMVCKFAKNRSKTKVKINNELMRKTMLKRPGRPRFGGSFRGVTLGAEPRNDQRPF